VLGLGFELGLRVKLSRLRVNVKLWVGSWTEIRLMVGARARTRVRNRK
jgi:hypothetical protein